MANQLRAEQKTIYQIFDECKKAFLIPEYQRPYSWERDECRTLWENLCEFAFPDDKIQGFDRDNAAYFMGTILTSENDAREDEVIDGQQRLVTFLLMLRAFYETLSNAPDDEFRDICKKIESCIWKLDDDDKPDKTKLKLDYEVIVDDESAELKKILTTGESTPKNKSNYALNYRLFQRWIADLNATKTGYLKYLVRRILNNCVLLPIKADSQTTALRIFTTLNDRGRPLSDSDIFKAQFYKFYLNQSSAAKNKFVERWKALEELCTKNFHPRKGTPVDDLFMRYMYYLLAKGGTKNDTFVDMRNYYEKNNYEVLRDDKTLDDLETLAKFWDDVATRSEKFSSRVLKQFYVLSYAPYGIWVYIVSLYFMGNRNLDNEKFSAFLDKVTAMLLLNAITDPGTHSIRRPFFVEFANILRGNSIEFSHFRQDEKFFREQLRNTKFTRSRPITRSMLAWWTFHDEAQDLPPIDTRLEMEHIYAVKRHELHPLQNPDALEFLGNKALLEKRVNIRAADYSLEAKRKYYLGWQPAGKKYQPGTFNLELRELAETHNDFTEADIIERNEKIFDAFIAYLRGQHLLI